MSETKLTVIVELRPSAELRELLKRLLGPQERRARAEPPTEPPLTPDDLTARRAAQVPGVLDYLTRKEAADLHAPRTPCF